MLASGSVGNGGSKGLAKSWKALSMEIKFVKSKHSYSYRILNTYIKSREIKILPADTSRCGGLLKLNMPGVIIS